MKTSVDPRAVVGDVSMSESLLRQGEIMIGDKGLDGISLRQIGAAAGSKNNYAVQYYFGGLSGLVKAIVAKRSPAIEAERANLLTQAERIGNLSTRSLVEIFFLPLIDLIDESGEPRFARFMLALHRAPDGWEPLDDLFHMMPACARILDLMKSANPDIPAPFVWQRMRPISVMVLTYACMHTKKGYSSQRRQVIIESLLDMASAALCVPVRKVAASMMYDVVM